MSDLREAVDEDGPALADLIGSVYAEYPGCVLDLPGVDRDLTAIRSYLGTIGGRLWVVPDASGLAACVGYAPDPSDPLGGIELKRLYVRSDARNRGLGGQLTELVLSMAAVLRVDHVDLWSDTRFRDGHALYERFGWRQDGTSRLLHDPSDTEEYHFVRDAPDLDPTATAALRGEGSVLDEVELRNGRLGSSLRGTISGTGSTITYHVAVDERWATRDLVIALDGTQMLRLTSDGLGRWWQDQVEVGSLQGAIDVDLSFTPATRAISIRRAAAAGTATSDVTAVRIGWPDLEPGRFTLNVGPVGDRRWRFQGPSVTQTVDVDGNGLVTREDRAGVET